MLLTSVYSSKYINLIATSKSFVNFRSKLESRLTGRHDSEDSVYNENCKQKEFNMAELRSRLTDTGNIKRAMSKWHDLEKEQHK
jgi:hypothetical protein